MEEKKEYRIVWRYITDKFDHYDLALDLRSAQLGVESLSMNKNVGFAHIEAREVKYGPWEAVSD